MDKRQQVLHELQMAVATGCEVRIECEFVRLAYIAGSFDSGEIMAVTTNGKFIPVDYRVHSVYACL